MNNQRLATRIATNKTKMRQMIYRGRAKGQPISIISTKLKDSKI